MSGFKSGDSAKISDAALRRFLERHDEWCPVNGCRCGNCGPCAEMPDCDRP